MFYDQAPEDINAGEEGLKLENYKEVLKTWEAIVPKEKLVMGFEPGPQFNDGVWEGMDTDKTVIKYLKDNGYGGVFFWAINQPEVGDNALPLAAYAQNDA